ncbi:MAG: HPP family protein [Gammaproteobacteria bacterium]|nr:HPP family protein [Gammaproteobacteria bacterium]
MSPTKHLRHWLHLLGVQGGTLSHKEKFVSALGGFLGIFVVAVISRHSLNGTDALFITASMGASAVLLFAVPHGVLSQPWPLVASHFISALVGVVCAQTIPNTFLAGATAVALAILLMHYLRCIHPPGGATALTAVIGGPALHDLGYQFVLSPVMLNVVAILVCAIVFNAFFPWRRYPAFWGREKKHTASAATQESISHEDFLNALKEINSFVDVTEDDLLLIYELVTKARAQGHMQATQLHLGGYYSNGCYGDDWSVRQIVDESSEPDPAARKVIYKTVAGSGKRSTGCITRAEFASWAKHEVFRDDKHWKRILPESSKDQKTGHE